MRIIDNRYLTRLSIAKGNTAEAGCSSEENEKLQELTIDEHRKSLPVTGSVVNEELDTRECPQCNLTTPYLYLALDTGYIVILEADEVVVVYKFLQSHKAELTKYEKERNERTPCESHGA